MRYVLMSASEVICWLLLSFIFGRFAAVIFGGING